jgi:AcrR family transcriptional regulator
MAENNDEREQRILNAAAERIAHYGYDKTTVEEIARDAGISKGAIYLHFKSKEQLFEALLLRESDGMVARYFELLENDPQGMTIFNIYRYGLEVTGESPLIKAMFVQDRRVLGDYLRHVRDTAAYRQLTSFGIEAVRQFQKAGLIRADIDAEAVSYLLNALRYGILAMDAFTPSGQVPSVSQLGEPLAQMLDSGLAPREGEGNQQAAREILKKLLEAKTQFMEQRRKER